MMKRIRIPFDRLILLLILAIFLLTSVLQVSKFFGRNDLIFDRLLSSGRTASVEYYIGGTADSPVSTVATAEDTSFTTDRKALSTLESPTWIRIRVPDVSSDLNRVVFVPHEFVKMSQAFCYSGGKLTSLIVENDHLYPFIHLPASRDPGTYIYMKFDDLASHFNFSVRTDREDVFIGYQHVLLMYRLSNIAIVAVIFIVNLAFYRMDHYRDHLIHSIMLISTTNILFQISGIQKLLVGFNDAGYSYIWGLVTSLSAVFFLYTYFGVDKMSKFLRYSFRTIILLNIGLLIAVNLIRNLSFISNEFSVLLLVICAAGLFVSAYAILRIREITAPFAFGMLFLFLGTGIYVLATFGYISWNDFTANAIFAAAAVEAVLFTIGIFGKSKLEQKRIQELETEVATDPLTGLRNRLYFERTEIPHIEEEEKAGTPTSFLMMDIDHFKLINDTYGHAGGDKVLQELAQILHENLRDQDISMRWGGEEFLITLRNTSLHKASLTAEKIRGAVESHRFGGIGKVTVSIGIAEKVKGESFEDCIRQADDAMYQAKKQGRNRVAVAFEGNAPIRIKWSNLLACGNPIIDAEHRELLALMNAAIEANFEQNEKGRFPGVLEKILARSAEHFQHEEAILRAAIYPELEEHCRMHGKILADAESLRTEIIRGEKTPADAVEFLVNRLVMGHLISDDIRYFSYLHGEEISSKEEQ